MNNTPTFFLYLLKVTDPRFKILYNPLPPVLESRLLLVWPAPLTFAVLPSTVDLEDVKSRKIFWEITTAGFGAHHLWCERVCVGRACWQLLFSKPPALVHLFTLLLFCVMASPVSDGPFCQEFKMGSCSHQNRVYIHLIYWIRLRHLTLKKNVYQNLATRSLW